MVPLGAQGYSAEWTKPSVPPSGVFVWPSKPRQTDVWVGDSSSTACQMWVMVLRVEQTNKPAQLLFYKQPWKKYECWFVNFLGRRSLIFCFPTQFIFTSKKSQDAKNQLLCFVLPGSQAICSGRSERSGDSIRQRAKREGLNPIILCFWANGVIPADNVAQQLKRSIVQKQRSWDCFYWSSQFHYVVTVLGISHWSPSVCTPPMALDTCGSCGRLCHCHSTTSQVQQWKEWRPTG